ncbi:hypothetical protein LH128_07467 [Sphingomonas sp. LH128]|uniref:Uncharacterized protein n=1 Tax=Novosphingobium resinovorum TaxID=158500 RepID=A0A1D8AEY9_9SPHN|nr:MULTISPECIES: hypothetical protein [Sphingomonadaceae]AOR80670.1 hypothetical protein BES08_27990 [Novosphingobium resinovorum]EJU13681.1 hypothetical protein LH128_07467 [Sphingomonas sp. LH128]
MLFDAARLGRGDMIPVLMEAGANIDAVDAAGNDAASLARMQRDDSLPGGSPSAGKGTMQQNSTGMGPSLEEEERYS